MTPVLEQILFDSNVEHLWKIPKKKTTLCTNESDLAEEINFLQDSEPQFESLLEEIFIFNI